METELSKMIISVPQRENAGALSSNRFSYQQVWAFNHILDLIDDNKDFILFMEFHDDIFILDSSDPQQMIDFYQIKTNNKASKYITPTFITKYSDQYPDKMSIVQKMIENFVKFDSNTRGLHLVSNKNFNFGLLKDNTDSKNKHKILLKELDNNVINKMKEGMCVACNNQGSCKEDCLDLIYFDVSELDLNNYEDTVLGKFVRRLDLLGVQSTIEKTRAIYHTIMGEIRRINNCEVIAEDINDLFKKKSISRDQFDEWLNKLKLDIPDNIWDRIQPLLLSDGFSALELNKIYKQWKKLQIELMDVDKLHLYSLVREIDKIIEKTDFDNAKEWTEYIYNFISSTKEYEVFNKYYIYALIIKEIFE